MALVPKQLLMTSRHQSQKEERKVVERITSCRDVTSNLGSNLVYSALIANQPLCMPKDARLKQFKHQTVEVLWGWGRKAIVRGRQTHTP